MHYSNELDLFVGLPLVFLTKYEYEGEQYNNVARLVRVSECWRF